MHFLPNWVFSNKYHGQVQNAGPFATTPNEKSWSKYQNIDTNFLGTWKILNLTDLNGKIQNLTDLMARIKCGIMQIPRCLKAAVVGREGMCSTYVSDCKSPVTVAAENSKCAAFEIYPQQCNA